jgi:sugar-specific transcriptional regulator TrmB
MKSEKLQKLGLAKNEAIIYSALAELGDVPVSNLLEKTLLHPNLAYYSLDTLQAKGLVAETIRDHKKYYRLSDPHILVSSFESKLELARNVEKEVIELNRKSLSAQKVTVFQGQKAVVMARKFIIDSIDDNGTYYVLNANIKEFGKAMGGEFERQERELKKRAIKQIFLGYQDQIGELDKFKPRYFKGVEREYYFLPQTSSIPMSIDFSEERASILVFGSGLLAIGISDKILARGYLKLFNTLLEISKKYGQIAKY